MCHQQYNTSKKVINVTLPSKRICVAAPLGIINCSMWG